MDYKTKTIGDVQYEIRSARFMPKNWNESVLAMKLPDNEENHDKLEYALGNGIGVEALVPIVKTIQDIENLQSVFTEDYLVSCFVHGIAIKEQAKSRAVLENLARPKKSRLTEKRYGELFLKLTPDDWKSIANAQGETTKAAVLKTAIDRLNNNSK